ncbi:MAG: M20/M25/M40 family metallo-hydrolase [Herpetosiphonaceae bacterium]|nr:M20/M25/M40 family metallo-hydrolase [Herpetosiphonaceae bacterium]
MISPWHDVARALTLNLVAHASVTNTPGEVTFADHLLALLREHPYFQAHPAQVWLEPISNDPRQRRNVWALVRGTGAQTVVLAGHYDVVSLANYGPLEPWSCNPEALLPRLIADLRTSVQSEGDELALRDLESGAFLPGRGALDMKSGLAAGLAVLFRCAEAPTSSGNLLFIATPDEEDTSYGMRGVTSQLPAIIQQWGLDPIAAINLDATGDRAGGEEGQAIFLGSVGKLLPSAYIIGRDTHAGAPFDGLNPNLLAAAITRRLECNVALSDVAEGEVAPPPTCLQQIDLKSHYDVTTPATAWCVYNVLNHTRTPAQVLALFQTEVQTALDEATSAVAEQGRRYAGLTGHAATHWQPRVLTFAELKAHVLEQGGAAREQDWAELKQRLAGDLDLSLPQLSRCLTEALWQWSSLTGPAVVIGFASFYYPAVLVGKTRPRHTRLREVAVHQAAVSRRQGVPVYLRAFLPGISDMSLLGTMEEAGDLTPVLANTPPYGSRIRFDYAAVQALDLPTINVGPWGRDYHQRTERVYTPYTFGQLPELIHQIVQELLNELPHS